MLGNNFSQAIVRLASYAIEAKYSFILRSMENVDYLFLYGAPQSAKTTALKAALSAFGDSNLVQAIKSMYHIC